MSSVNYFLPERVRESKAILDVFQYTLRLADSLRADRKN